MIRSFGVCSMSRYVDASEPRLLQTEWRVWLCAEARGDEKIQSEYGVVWSYVCAAPPVNVAYRFSGILPLHDRASS